MVETAMYVFSTKKKQPFHSLFIKLSSDENRDLALESSISEFELPKEKSSIFICNIDTFYLIPKSPFAYWVPDSIRTLFSELPNFENKNRHGHIGALSQDDFRFVRLWWEVPLDNISTEWTNSNNKTWVPYTKGGTFAPYYKETPALLNWKKNGEELKAFLVAYRKSKGFADSWTGQLNSYSLYFTKGLTWSSRPLGQGSFWVLPEGCIFRHSAPAVMDKDEESLLYDLGILNSVPYRFLLDLLMPRGSAGTASLKYELGYVRSVPIPLATINDTAKISNLTADNILKIKSAYSYIETSHHFQSPVDFKFNIASSFKVQLDRIESVKKDIVRNSGLIDEIVKPYYKMNSEMTDKLLVNSNVKSLEASINQLEVWRNFSVSSFSSSIISYLVGVVFGRWELNPSQLSDRDFAKNSIFQKLTIPGKCGQIGHPDTSLPLNDIFDDTYQNNGILPAIIAQLDKLDKDGCSEKYSELLEECSSLLGVKDIQEYLNKTKFFFDYHIQQYTESGRQAPIYWPLQTQSGSYTLWLYYLRLNEQTLYTCVNDFVEPKLEQVEQDLNGLRSKSARNSHEEKELEKLSDLASELRDFRDELLRIAKFWKPNLNDGVQITAAPLWKLFQHKAWQKKLKETWESLEQGEYDWAHLACSIWPERVLRKCHQDRSLAIAHDVEDHFWHEVEVPVTRGKKATGETKFEWQPRDLSESELNALVKKLAAERG